MPARDKLIKRGGIGAGSMFLLNPRRRRLRGESAWMKGNSVGDPRA